MTFYQFCRIHTHGSEWKRGQIISVRESSWSNLESLRLRGEVCTVHKERPPHGWSLVMYLTDYMTQCRMQRKRESMEIFHFSLFHFFFSLCFLALFFSHFWFRAKFVLAIYCTRFLFHYGVYDVLHSPSSRSPIPWLSLSSLRVWLSNTALSTPFSPEPVFPLLIIMMISPAASWLPWWIAFPNAPNAPTDPWNRGTVLLLLLLLLPRPVLGALAIAVIVVIVGNRY